MSEPLPRVYLARHGETAWTVSKQHTGRTDIPLTARGEANARSLGERLKGETFELVFVSPLDRARKTCELAGFGALGRPEDALKVYREAVEHQRKAFVREPDASREWLDNHLTGLASTARELGRPAEAAAATRERQVLRPKDPGHLVAVAADLAACIPLVGRGKPTLTEDEQAEQARYAAATVEILNAAVSAGLKDLKQLRENPALAPIRERSEFRRLLEMLEKK